MRPQNVRVAVTHAEPAWLDLPAAVARTLIKAAATEIGEPHLSEKISDISKYLLGLGIYSFI